MSVADNLNVVKIQRIITDLYFVKISFRLHNDLFKLLKMPSIAKPHATQRASRQSYHHGALRQTLIDATELLLAERGPEGFSLREIARRSGVSAAAPAYHFTDSEGLLSVVATMAFEALQIELEEGRKRGGDDPVARLREQGVGYVRFALRYPGRFKLMFRNGFRQDVELSRAARSAYVALEDSVRALLDMPANATLDAVARRTLWSIWSVVHGFAHLALAGQFNPPPEGDAGALALTSSQKVALLTQHNLLIEVLPAMLEQQLAAWARPGYRPGCAAAPPRG